MADFVWCHGPECHTRATQDRVRGSKGSKVLRTRKIKQQTDRAWYNPNNWYNWFCSMSCYNDFANKYADAMRRIAPRTEPLETPCEVKKETHTDYYENPYTRTYVTKLDNADQ